MSDPYARPGRGPIPYLVVVRIGNVVTVLNAYGGADQNANRGAAENATISVIMVLRT